jgi:hypothetical protein
MPVLHFELVVFLDFLHLWTCCAVLLDLLQFRSCCASGLIALLDLTCVWTCCASGLDALLRLDVLIDPIRFWRLLSPLGTSFTYGDFISGNLLQLWRLASTFEICFSYESLLHLFNRSLLDYIYLLSGKRYRGYLFSSVLDRNIFSPSEHQKVYFTREIWTFGVHKVNEIKCTFKLSLMSNKLIFNEFHQICAAQIKTLNR